MFRNIIIALSAVALAGGIYIGWPIYGFFAHGGEVPLPFWGWVERPSEAAPGNQVAEPGYAGAGSRALAKLEAHRQKLGAPAMSAAVAINGEVVWAGAVGWADMAERKAATPQNQFRIGSTSKALTATALARLVDKGVIDLDEPIGTYVNDLPNEAWATITPRMLASHMAGVPHYDQVENDPGKLEYAIMRKHFGDMRDALSLFDDSPLLFEPGADFEYSSLGTVLLGATMEAAAGERYRDVVKLEVLDPIGMGETIVAPKRAGRGDDLASFYLRRGERFRIWRPVDLSHRLPGGGWASSPSDLVRMGAGWLDADYITPDTRDQFWAPQRLFGGEVNEQDYAIGWRWREFEVEGLPAVRNANHGGVSRGSQSWLMVLPDYDMAIAVNINMRTDNFWDFGSAWEGVFRPFVELAHSKNRKDDLKNLTTRPVLED
ncbi:MAG: serine hydrolase domain-containing protein [Pseudomonadota bacterium]